MKWPVSVCMHMQHTYKPTTGPILTCLLTELKRLYVISDWLLVNTFNISGAEELELSLGSTKIKIAQNLRWNFN